MVPRSLGFPHARLRRAHGRGYGVAAAGTFGTSRTDNQACCVGKTDRDCRFHQRKDIMSEKPLLLVEHVTMRFGGLVALDALPFQAADPSTTPVTRPTGPGQTH